MPSTSGLSTRSGARSSATPASSSTDRGYPLEAFLISALVVAVGEIGDKTQLLALMLSARFRHPGPIILGILCATLLNHALAGLLGGWIRTAIEPDSLRWALGISFLAIAAWALVPDKFDAEPQQVGKYGAFAVTLVAFFLAEIGDKTQLATVALAARFDSLVAVVAGTTGGMLLADVPAVFLADRASGKIPMAAIRYVAAALFAAALFAAMGVAVLAGFSLS